VTPVLQLCQVTLLKDLCGRKNSASWAPGGACSPFWKWRPPVSRPRGGEHTRRSRRIYNLCPRRAVSLLRLSTKWNYDQFRKQLANGRTNARGLRGSRCTLLPRVKPHVCLTLDQKKRKTNRAARTNLPRVRNVTVAMELLEHDGFQQLLGGTKVFDPRRQLTCRIYNYATQPGGAQGKKISPIARSSR